jgi:hypothetical protein
MARIHLLPSIESAGRGEAAASAVRSRLDPNRDVWNTIEDR